MTKMKGQNRVRNQPPTLASRPFSENRLKNLVLKFDLNSDMYLMKAEMESDILMT